MVNINKSPGKPLSRSLSKFYAVSPGITNTCVQVNFESKTSEINRKYFIICIQLNMQTEIYIILSEIEISLCT